MEFYLCELGGQWGNHQVFPKFEKGAATVPTYQMTPLALRGWDTEAGWAKHRPDLLILLTQPSQ